MCLERIRDVDWVVVFVVKIGIVGLLRGFFFIKFGDLLKFLYFECLIFWCVEFILLFIFSFLFIFLVGRSEFLFLSYDLDSGLVFFFGEVLFYG